MVPRLSMGSIRTSFADRPIEYISSFSLIFLGLVLAVSSEGPVSAFVSSTLAALGGLLLSWTAAAVSTNEDAARILKPQLLSLSSQLGNASTQLGQTIEQLSASDITVETALYAINLTNNQVCVAINDLQSIIGDGFNSEGYLATVRKINELKARLRQASADSEVSGKPELESSEDSEEIAMLRSEVQRLEAQLRSSFSPSSMLPKKKVHADCPYCNSRNLFYIGDYHGATTSPRCQNCGKSFHAHNVNEGIITRVVGANEDAAVAPSVSFSNPATILEYDAYRRTLKSQGVVLLKEHVRGPAIKSICRVIGERGPIMESWEAIDEFAMRDLAARGYEEINAIELKRARHLMYRARLFELHQRDGLNTGIGLVQGVDERNASRKVDQNLLSRICQFNSPPYDKEALSKLLYGEASYGLDMVADILKDLDNP